MSPESLVSLFTGWFSTATDNTLHVGQLLAKGEKSQLVPILDGDPLSRAPRGPYRGRGRGDRRRQDGCGPTYWLGSEIEQDGLDLEQFTAEVLDGTKPLTSYLEDSLPAETFTAEESTMCMAGGG
jgi:hypothetical protein